MPTSLIWTFAGGRRILGRGMAHQEEILIETTGHRDIHDITPQVADVVDRSDVQTGTTHIFCVGSTGVIGTCDVKPRSRKIIVTVQGDTRT